MNRNKTEKISKIYAALANEYKELTSASLGNIVVVTGLVDSITGDTIVTSSGVAERARQEYEKDASVEPSDDPSRLPILAGPLVIEPVFFCSIEAPSPSKVRPLEEALIRLQREDPSLRVKVDEQQQMVLSGMGELHLDIIKDRLLREYGIEAYFGPLQVSYRETIKSTAEHELAFEKHIGGARNTIKMKLVVKPSDDEKVQRGQKFRHVKVIVTQENELGKIRPDRLKAINHGIETAFSHGPLLSFPIIGVDVELHEFHANYTSTPAVVASAAGTCVLAACQKAGLELLEPIMRLAITAPKDYNHRIQSDLTNRRGQLGNYNERSGGIRVLDAEVPLAELVNYSTTLRTISSGTATLSMEFSSYSRMNDIEYHKAHQRVTGLVQ